MNTENTITIPFEQLKQLRAQEIQDNMKQRLSLLANEAADIRKEINSAKTNVKKQYYEKKFKKVRSTILNLLVSLERLKQTHPVAEQDATVE